MSGSRPTTINRKKWLTRGQTAFFLLGVLLWLPAANAIIVLRDPGRNLNPPTGAWANSGWQWEGDWHRFPGTVVGPHHFLTAAHTGGLPLQPFRFRGKDYYAIEKAKIPGTDLALWRITGTFPDWATLYDADAEQGKTIMIYGRGGPRGVSVVVHGQQRGYWSTDADGRLSWGRNRVAEVIANSAPRNPYGQLITFFFDPDSSGAGPDTAAVSGGDSGGGVFLRNSPTGEWQLAGVIYGVDRSYAPSQNAVSNDFAVALYDARGLYRSSATGRFLIDPNGSQKSPTTCLASRVSPFVPQLRDLIRQPPHWPYYVLGLLTLLGLLGAFAWGAIRRSQRNQNAQNQSVPLA